MRNNYHNPTQSEDSVTKISRSKSRNQMAMANKIKEKVTHPSSRNADGTNVFIWNIYPSIITRTNLTRSVLIHLSRPQKQIAHPRQKVHLIIFRNDRNDLSKAKRVH